MNKRLIALVAGVLAVALAIAGCGGGDDDEATASTITKAQFIKQADAACKEAEGRLQKDFSAYVEDHADITQPTEQDYADLITAVLVPNVEQEVEEIRALGAPSGDEEQVEELLESLEQSSEAALEEPEVALSESKKIFAETSRIAKEYGLEACAAR